MPDLGDTAILLPWRGERAQWVERGAEKPAAELTRVQFPDADSLAVFIQSFASVPVCMGKIPNTGIHTAGEFQSSPG